MLKHLALEVGLSSILKLLLRMGWKSQQLQHHCSPAGKLHGQPWPLQPAADTAVTLNVTGGFQRGGRFCLRPLSAVSVSGQTAMTGSVR